MPRCISSTSPDERSAEQIFGPPAEAGHGLAVQPLREILRQRPAQIAAAHLDLGEARAFHRGLEAAAHRLDFGQFGHRLNRVLASQQG